MEASPGPARVLVKPSPPQPFYDLGRLFDFRAKVDTLEPAAPPTAISCEFSGGPGDARVGILAGSFNPPTEAHRELASRAAQSFRLDRVFLTLARATVDKETATGLCPEDRLLLLSLMAKDLDCASVAAVNRGLYFEQVEAFRRLLGGRIKLFVIAGMDKVPQIFDPRYYADRDSALHKLFAEAQLIAAGRGPLQESDLERFLDRPENRPYRDRIYFMAMPDQWRDLSSGNVREKILSHESLQQELPAVVREFIEATGCYLPPAEKSGEKIDPYGQRVALMNILYPARSWAEKEADFPALLKTALGEGRLGSGLRSLIRSVETKDATLKPEALAAFVKTDPG